MMRAAAAALLLTAIAAPGGAAAQATFACAPDQAVFDTPGGVVRFDVEIADDSAERARGLMYRRELPEGQGMLFIYEDPQPVAFWMKNTLIPLDLIFMDATGLVRHIHPMARPLDETAIPGALPGDPVPTRLMVLEIAGGEAARLGLSPGVTMAHPRLDQQRAALPCD